MFKALFFISFVFGASSAFASYVEHIVPAGKGELETLIFTRSGRVLFVEKEELIRDFKFAKQQELSFNYKLDSKGNIGEVSFLGRDLQSYERRAIVDIDPLFNFRVSRANSVATIKQMFLRMNPNLRRRSECYNRAHIWSYNLSTNLMRNKTLNIGKMWIFFTKKYIREFRYGWWFHVAPYTMLSGSMDSIVLDRTFAQSPKRLIDWKNMFIKNQSTCPMIKKYSDYSLNQDSSYCYLIQSSMFYYQPYQLQELEENGVVRNQWFRSELDQAYRDAL